MRAPGEFPVAFPSTPSSKGCAHRPLRKADLRHAQSLGSKGEYGVSQPSIGACMPFNFGFGYRGYTSFLLPLSDRLHGRYPCHPFGLRRGDQASLLRAQLRHTLRRHGRGGCGDVSLGPVEVGKSRSRVSLVSRLVSLGSQAVVGFGLSPAKTDGEGRERDFVCSDQRWHASWRCQKVVASPRGSYMVHLGSFGFGLFTDP